MSNAKPTKNDVYVLGALKLQLEKFQADFLSFPQEIFPNPIWIMIAHYATDDPRIIDAIALFPSIEAEMLGVDLKCDCCDDEDDDGRCPCLTHIKFSLDRSNVGYGMYAFSMLLQVDDHFYEQNILDAIASMRKKLYDIIQRHLS